ncbi:autotransporter outer membrane beta-barrel domain-containing protein [Microvirga zambiensis]|uniref:autotransporter family protein n=1 Tax=Microvirga zambiensis TaxID=1402137 RepID=UPI00191D07A8|nr:autotransporter outer membrane beta-barrel domain-containing protein [Microvirga zambiensis]
MSVRADGAITAERQKWPRARSSRKTFSPGLSSALGGPALGLAIAVAAGPAQAACTTSVSGGQTRVVCSGATTDHYWAADDTPSSVEVQAGTTMQTSGAAIRVEGNSTVTIANGATVAVTGGNADHAYNAIYVEDDGSTVTNNGTVSTVQNSVDGLEATGSRNTLVNTGGVSTQGISSEAIIARGHANTLRNSGILETSGASARGMIAEGNDNTLVNTGTIRTTGAGGEGIRADGGGTTTPAQNATIANSGTITTGGFTADGIRLIGNDSTVTNDGTITASGVEGRGVKIEGHGNRVDNRGTIQGLGADGEGLYVISNAGQTNTIVNHADGQIIGRSEVGLRGRFGAEEIENFGLIRTDVTGGAAVDLNAGNDSFLIGASSTIQGFVRAGAGTDTFRLGGAANATFDAREIGASAKYREFERFEKVGTSTWTTENDNNAAMPWAVREGTLLVTGSMGGSAMTVHGGATLGGTGTVGSIDALTGSNLSPGVAGAASRAGVGDIRTLNVRNDVTIAPGTTYRVDLNDRFESDRIVAGGQATIRGGTVEVHAERATYSPGRWTILTAQRGVTGQFSDVDDLIFFQPILTKDTNNVYLELLPVFPGVDPTPRDAPGDPGEPLSRPVPPLQPETTPPIAILHHENLFRAAILCRLRCSSSDAMGAVPSFVAIDSVPMPPQAHGQAQRQPAGAAAAPTQGTGWGVWGKLLGSIGRTDATPTSAAMERNTGGIVVGVDGGLGTPYRLGIAAGYLATSFDIDAAAASGDIDSFHIGAYGSAAFGAWNLRGGIAYAHHEIDLARGAIAGRFSGGDTSTSADSLQVFGVIGYTFLLSDRVSLEPFAGLAHIHVSSHDIVENASPFRANGEVASFDTTYSTLGARLVAAVPTEAGLVTFKGMLGWRHAFGDVAPEARFAVNGFPAPFLVVGAPIDRDSLVVEAGVNWQVSETVAVGVMYDGALGPRDQEHTLRGSVSVRF